MSSTVKLEKALALCNAAGMPYRRSKPEDWGQLGSVYNHRMALSHSWNGHELIISTKEDSTCPRDGDDILHELCHWLVSRRRRQPEFGLGSAPYADVHRHYDQRDDSTKAQREEVAVCVLQLYFLRFMHLPWRPQADDFSLGPYYVSSKNSPKPWDKFINDRFEYPIADTESLWSSNQRLERRGLIKVARKLVKAVA